MPPGSLVQQDMRDLAKRVIELEKVSPIVVVDRKDEKLKSLIPVPEAKAPPQNWIKHIESNALKLDDPYAHCLYLLKKRGVVSPAVHNKLRARAHTANDPIRVSCFERVTAGSGANTILSTVSTLQPFNNTDAKAFAALYDEGRCTLIEVLMQFTTRNSSTQAPASPVQKASGGFAFDPANSGVYSALEQIFEAKEHVGPFNCVQPALICGVTWVTKTGYVKLHCVPMANVPTSTGAVIGSNWTSASDTSAIAGYIKPFVENLGATTEFVVDYFIKYHNEFAFRT